MKVFMLRGQGIGVIHDRVYFAYPSNDEIQRAMVDELSRHGIKGGKPVERWVRVIPVELHGFAGAAPPVPENAPDQYVGSLPQEIVDKVMKNSKQVMSISDAGHAEAVNMAAVGFATVTPAEVETITTADVGELKL